MEAVSVTSTFYSPNWSEVKNLEESRKGTGVPIRLDSVNGYEQVVQKGMVTPGRLELPTRSLGNCCSIHLSYGAV